MDAQRARGTVAVMLLRSLLDSGRRAGVDPSRVLREIGVSQETHDDVNGVVPIEAMARAWTLVPELSRDPDFGLHAGETTPTGSYGVLEFAAISSATALEAIQRYERYHRMMAGMTEIVVREEGASVHLALRPKIAIELGGLRHYVEHVFALLVTRARMLTNDGLGPIEARFAHATPPNTSEHARIFRGKLAFGRATNEMIADRQTLEVPLCTANPLLSKLLEETSGRVLPQPDEDIVGAVKRVLAVALREGDARLSIVARKLRTSERSLQRELGKKRASYADLLDEARREAARAYVADPAMNLGEIAFVLGFSQPSAFHRAFKRWTGTTPKEYRDAARATRRFESDG